LQEISAQQRPPTSGACLTIFFSRPVGDFSHIASAHSAPQSEIEIPPLHARAVYRWCADYFIGALGVEAEGCLPVYGEGDVAVI